MSETRPPSPAGTPLMCGTIFQPDDPVTAPRLEKRGEQIPGKVCRVAIWAPVPDPSDPNVATAWLYIEGASAGGLAFDPPRPVRGSTSMQAVALAFGALQRHLNDTAGWYLQDGWPNSQDGSAG